MKGMVSNGVVENIQREIDTDYIVNLLDNYIEYQNKCYLTEEDKYTILKFIVHLMYKGEVLNELDE